MRSIKHTQRAALPCRSSKRNRRLLRFTQNRDFRNWHTSSLYLEHWRDCESSLAGPRGAGLFRRHQTDHAEIYGEDAVVCRDAPCWAGVNINAIFIAFRKIRFQDEKTGTIQLPAAHFAAVGVGSQFHRMSLACMAADAQALRTRLDADQAGGCMFTDPAVFVAEDAFQVVPAVQQAIGMTGKAEIDDVCAISGILFRAIGRGQKIVDRAFVWRAIGAARADQGVFGIASERRMTIRTAQQFFEFGFVERETR